MRTLKLRPTFSISLKTDSNVAWARIQETVDSHSEEIQGQFRGHHAIIAIVEKNRHFWSPWLNLEIRKSETGDEIHGRFSPHPSIWTGFAFSYLSLAFISLFGLIYGCSQLLMDATPFGFLITPLCALLALVLWGVGQIGQGLAKEDMAFIRNVIERGVDRRGDHEGS